MSEETQTYLGLALLVIFVVGPGVFVYLQRRREDWEP